MKSNVISFKEYKKKKTKGKFNLIDKIGLWLNTLTPLIALSTLGFLMIRPMQWFGILLGSLLILISVLQMFKVYEKIKAEQMYTNSYYFTFFYGMTGAFIMIAIFICLGLEVKNINLKTYFYPLSALMLLEFYMIYRYAKKEKYYV